MKVQSKVFSINPEIALIDSGINPWHFHVQGVEGGLAYCLNSRGNVIEDSDFSDTIGHGTAIAGIIREKVSFARLYAVKIFHKDLNASVSQLLAALEWAIDKNIKIIHLSLGTQREEYMDDLQRLCQYAYDKGIVIIAAARAPDDRLFPSVFETVIGVYWNHECDETSIVYHPENAVEFGAYGWPRAIPGLPQERNFRGNSFAAAHITAKAAQLLEKNPNAGTLWVREMLTKTAKKNDQKPTKEMYCG